MSINRETDKEDVIHIYNGILLSHKKEPNCAICSDVDGPTVKQSEVSQKEKNITQRDACTPMFIAALFTIAKTKQPKYSLTDKWLKKM